MVKSLTQPRTSHAAARADRSVGILEAAVRRHVRIELALETEGEPIFGHATILSLAGPVLTLQLAAGENRQDFLRPQGSLRARFSIDGRCFEFDAAAVENPITAHDDLLAFRRPVSIRSVERRRVARRQLHESTEITIQPEGADAPLRAGMLNVSDFGLACRILRDHVDGLPVGTGVRVGFSIEGEPNAFHLGGQVVNFTPASDGKWILGVEFDKAPANAAELGRLRRVLGAPSTDLSVSTSHQRPGASA